MVLHEPKVHHLEQLSSQKQDFSLGCKQTFFLTIAWLSLQTHFQKYSVTNKNRMRKSKHTKY